MSDILSLTICGVVSGANTWVEIEEYGESKKEWLETFLSLPHGIPSHDTLSDVFARLNPDELETGFQNWVASLAEGMTDAQIRIDGKMLRGSGDKAKGKKPLHLVSAWVGEANLIVGQVKTDDKSNEITAIPELLKLLVLEGSLVTIGAMRTQTNYFISSRSASATYFLQAVRGYWSIENQLHWSLDVTFREDHNQTRTGFAVENLALFRRLILILLKRETSIKVGLQAKRLRAGWSNDYLLKVLRT